MISPSVFYFFLFFSCASLASLIADLNACGLRLSDLPMQDPTRDIVLMGEHLYSEIQSAYQLDKANKALNEGILYLRVQYIVSLTIRAFVNYVYSMV
jgi:hypothetical protein